MSIVNEIKSVTVNNHEFENYGWCFVIVGSPGSGKSYFIKNKLLGQGKIFDIDDFREKYKKLLKQKNKKISSFKELQAFSGEKIMQSEKNFLNAQQNYKGNIIFDLAGRPGKHGEPSQLEQLITMVKQFGYKVAIVWIVTNRSVAMQRNIERGLTKTRAIIPDKSFHQRTNQTNKFMPAFLQSNFVGSNVDLSYIVFSSSYSLNDMSDNEKQNCVIPLPKECDRFIITPQIMDYVVRVLGPKETSNGFTPEVYKTNSQVRNILKTGEKYNDFLKDSGPINEKKVIRIDENSLKRIVKESIKKVLSEYNKKG